MRGNCSVLFLTDPTDHTLDAYILTHGLEVVHCVRECVTKIWQQTLGVYLNSICPAWDEFHLW